jgi:hypothetical protein
MPITKQFFDTLEDRMKNYFDMYPSGVVNINIRASFGEIFQAVKFIERGDDWLTFAHYARGQSVRLDKKTAPEQRGQPMAHPVIALPYENIVSVEFIPAAPGNDEIGFVPPDED